MTRDRNNTGGFDDAARRDVTEGTVDHSQECPISQNETNARICPVSGEPISGTEDGHGGKSPDTAAPGAPGGVLLALADAYVSVLRSARSRRAHRPDLDGVTNALADRASVIFERAIDAPTWPDVVALSKIAGELDHV